MGRAGKALCRVAVICGACAVFAVPAAWGEVGAPGPEACPNGEVRERQSSTELPECRAYEMVTPVEKNGNEVTGFLTVQGSPDGDRVAFGSTGAFPGSEAAPAISSYLSNRGGSGWGTRALTPPQLNPGAVLGAGARDFSRDLALTLTVSKLALAPGAVPGNGNVYIEDMLTGELQFVATTSDPSLYDAATNTGGTGIVYGGSDSFDHIIINSPARLLAGAPEGVSSLYDLHNGELSLVSILPNGQPAPGGVGIFGGFAALAEANVVSTDGRRVFFEADNRLYERINGEHTVEVSATEVPGSEELPSASFGGASDDGSVVYFTSPARLTVAGEPVPSEGFPARRLYRYANGHLEQLAVGIPSFSATLQVLSVSPDGDTVYFVIEDQRGESTEARQPRIYRWQLGQGLSEVVAFEDLGEFDRAPARWTVSPNGRYAAFQALSLLTPNAKPGNCTLENSSAHRLEGRCYEIYVLDTQSGELTCASCSPGGGAPAGLSSMGGLFAAELVLSPTFSHYAPRGIGNDGTVYFDTPTRLTGNDGDARRDVYQWHGGEVSLLTPGTTTDTAYADASTDGSTVFVLTADKLVSQDVDFLRDLYAVRRDGGLISQNPVSALGGCEGESCLTAAAGPPSAKAPGSLQFKEAAGAEAQLRVPLKVLIHGARGTVRVTVPGAGTVRLRGGALRPTGHSFGSGGSGGVPVALAGDRKQRLFRHGWIEVKARLIYQPTHGKAVTRRVVLTFVNGKGR